MNNFLNIYTKDFLDEVQNRNDCKVFLLANVDLMSNMFKSKTKSTTTELLNIISFENLAIFFNEINYYDYKTGFNMQTNTVFYKCNHVGETMHSHVLW